MPLRSFHEPVREWFRASVAAPTRAQSLGWPSIASGDSTLILAPTGFQTLATQVWGAVGDGFYARAAPSALLLVGLSMGSVALLLRGEERA